MIGNFGHWPIASNWFIFYFVVGVDMKRTNHQAKSNGVKVRHCAYYFCDRSEASTEMEELGEEAQRHRLGGSSPKYLYGRFS